MTARTDPNPGSPEALAAGCICPVIDNHYGRGIHHRSGPLFWFNATCPLHGDTRTLQRDPE